MNNIMRHEYNELDQNKKVTIDVVKDLGLKFWEQLDRLDSSRELSIAKTKVEEAVMWAIKHITT